MTTFRQIKFKENEYEYPDTSVLLQFLGYDNDVTIRHNVAKLFSEAHNSNATLVVSEITFDEILHVIIKNAFKKVGCRSQDDIKKLRETVPDTYNRVLGQALNDYQSYKRKVLSNDSFLPEPLCTSSETRMYRDQIMYLVKNIGELNELADVIIVDTGAGVSDQVLEFVLASPEVLLVTTPEPSSLTDSYSLLKALYRNPVSSNPEQKLRRNRPEYSARRQAIGSHYDLPESFQTQQGDTAGSRRSDRQR